MLDMIMIVCIIVMVGSGLAYLILPADKLVKQDKIKNGETFEDAAKKIRKSGILYLVLGVFFFLTTFVI